MTGWTFPDILDAIAAATGDRAAIVQGERVLAWGELARRADALSRAFSRTAAPGAKAAVLARNAPEFLETYYAAFKAGLAPVNLNWRYGPFELAHVLDDSGAEIVVFDRSFEAVAARTRDATGARRWIGFGPDPAPWAEDYEEAIAQADARAPRHRPHADDVLLLYTGGTTGKPKGVVWRQEDLIHVLGAGQDPVGPLPAMTDPAEAGPRAAAVAAGELEGRGPMITPAPLMHATALLTSLSTLISGGTVVLCAGRSYDAARMLDEAQARSATVMTLAGQAFAAPLLEAMDAAPGRWPLPALRRIGSSGTFWSVENKKGLLRHLPHVDLADALGSSEAVGIGSSVSSVGAVAEGARFAVGGDVQVFTTEGEAVVPGSGASGLLALSGRIPLGYHNDPAKTAQTFREIGGRRWSMPGDVATVDADGSIRLLGRGSSVINTGGEKVHPEEVEEALKSHPGVRDALVVGLPDPRFGEKVCALVEMASSAQADPELLRSHVRERLAPYKVPRLLLAGEVPRGPNGKADLAEARRLLSEG